jgi:hypothetical protein
MPKIRCRKCGRQIRYRSLKDAPHFPFCSRTCQLVDLGRWFNEEHRISTPIPHTPKDEKESPDSDRKETPL